VTSGTSRRSRRREESCGATIGGSRRGSGRLGRELERQVVRVDDRVGLDARVVRRPEDAHDPDLGVGGAGRVADDVRDDHVVDAPAVAAATT
jgi:hypothetical protein